MNDVVTRLRRDIDEPGEFLDWLISVGWTTSDACGLIRSGPYNPTCQQWLRRWESERTA